MQSPYSIAKSDSASVAAGKILGKEIHHINVFAQGVIERDDTNPLHDLRVSIRKLRAAIKFFAPFLKHTSAGELDGSFASLSDDLGPARDFDAWLEYLQSGEISEQLAGNAAYEGYVARLMEERQEHLPEICFLLESTFSAGLRDQIQEFTERQLPALLDTDASSGFFEYSGRRLYRYYRKVARLAEVTPGTAVNDIHQLRKKCRRGRYWAEFTGTVAGAPAAQLAKHFKGVATALGTARDMQLHVAQLHSSELELPAELTEWHHTMEQKAWRKYARTWRQMTEKSFKRQLKRDLVGRSKSHD